MRIKDQAGQGFLFGRKKSLLSLSQFDVISTPQNLAICTGPRIHCDPQGLTVFTGGNDNMAKTVCKILGVVFLIVGV
ncbi:MAG TPA: hypothetical protein VIT19_01775, partial [Pyrinomonadaceae bacterium]